MSDLHLLRSWPVRENSIHLLTETRTRSSNWSTADLVKESIEKTGKLLLRGVMQRADALNQNGRVYPRPILEREVRNYQKFILEHRALGECDHPDTSVVELKNACLNVEELVMKDNGDVVGTIEVLWKVPAGMILKGLVEHGIKIGISSRGVGGTYQKGDYTIVDDTYQMISFDAVSEPSTSGAFMLPEGLKLSQDDILELKRYRSCFTEISTGEESHNTRVNHLLDEILRK